MSLRSFLLGPPAWRDGSAWRWPWAVLAALAILVTSQGAGLAAAVLRGLLAGGKAAPAGSGGGDVGAMAIGEPDPAAAMLPLVVSQAAIVAMVLVAVGRGQANASELRLGEPDGGRLAYLWAIVALLPVLAVVNALAWTLRPEDALRDFRFFASIAKSPDPLLPALAICVGAPLSEELLFRGFLLAPLAATRLGYRRSALLVAIAWTALHWNYSLVGLAEVLIIGLYLSWTLWRTGSLWMPIFVHAVYNTTLFLLLRWLPIQTT